MRFVLLNGPHDGATGDLSKWNNLAPGVVWAGPKPELGGPMGLAISPVRKPGRVPYERVEVVGGVARYVFAGGPSGVSPVDIEELVNA